MLFSSNITVCEFWAHQTEYKKSKMQAVAGRSYHSLSLRLSGEVLFDVGGKQTVSREKGITFMPAGLPYRTEVQTGGSMMLIHFRTTKKYTDLQPSFFETQDPEIATLFSSLCQSYTADGSNRYRCMALLYTLLDRLKRPEQPAPKRIRKAKQFIDRNFAEAVTVAALAQEAGISEVHFRNEFKHYFGVSPLTYLKKVRIDHARHLLRSGYHTVTEVAMECGFESTSYFSYEFKRMTGTTPSEYIKK